MITIQRLVTLASLLTFASAQTSLSTVPVIDGNTVILSASTDALGNPTPIVVGTVTDPGLSTPVATPGVTTPVVPGVTTTPLATSAAPTVTTSTPRVVGEPGPTGEAGPTIYTYMTTDANGNPTQVVDTYTPNYGYATTSSLTPKAGTIIPYDQYTSMYGGGSGGGGGSAVGNGAVRQSAAFGLGATAVACVLGGVALLL